MSRIVIKEAPDIDYYVEWSSVVEEPTFGGDRADMLGHLMSQHHEAENRPEYRLDRCDRTGTTALWEVPGFPIEGAWDDDGLIYAQRGTVARADLFTLTRRLLEDEGADVSDLIRPFDD